MYTPSHAPYSEYMNNCPLCHKKSLFSQLDSPVCDECNLRFSREEAFAKAFFGDRKYFKKSRELKYQEETLSVEVHASLAKSGLLYYATGLILRHEIGADKNQDSLLGSAYERIAKDYSSRTLEDLEYQFIVVKHEEPYYAGPDRFRLQTLNAVSIDIEDHTVILITDKNRLTAESPFWALVTHSDLIVLVESHPQENTLKKAAVFLKNHTL
ncbi:hypothetical protein [Bdellovibrio sp. HCB288]|uniref:hypothetical protein n=1 Tax=Bdellovibrio sp. HCB288 TaxID=3394355 RepID=UPI0039B4943C